MSYSTGWLVNAIKYLERSVFIYDKNGQNIALPIENSQRLDRLVRFVSSVAGSTNEANVLMFTPYTTSEGETITDVEKAIEAISTQKETNGGDLIAPISDGEKTKTFPSSNIYEALNTLAKEIKKGGYDFEVKNNENVFENMDNTFS